MILYSIKLRNFGVYQGHQEIDLAPSEGRPIVLIGALNGGGKTTLLEALQIALFGRSARFLEKRRGGYVDYMISSINRSCIPLGASVGVRFGVQTQGRLREYEVERTWSVKGTGISEFLKVQIDGEPSDEIGDRWPEFVEALIPSQISDLFFFDGERIESLADPDRSADLIRTGLHSLLGLDLVDDLSKSLGILERRLKVGKEASTDSNEMASRAARVDLIREELSRFASELASERTALDSVRNALNEAELSFRRAGGDLYRNHEQLKTENARLEKERDEVRKRMQDLAGGLAPLLHVEAALVSLRESAGAEERAQLDAALYTRLVERDARILEALTSNAAVPKKALKSMEAELSASRGALPGEGPAVPLEISAAECRAVLQQLSSLRTEAKLLVGRYKEIRKSLDAFDRKLKAVPDEARVAGLIERIEQLRARETELKARITQREEDAATATRSLAEAERRYEAVAAKVIDAQFGDQLQARMRTKLQRSRIVLSDFRARMRLRHIGRLEQLVTESFQQLIRKQGFVERIKIDPETFKLTIMGRSEVLPAERLSAGERQLLAVAVLWGLARACGRRLPTVIDTPLGRLDSVHRDLLINHYFPNASHQVILLSTDEEVVGEYYARLKQSVSQEWLVSYDDKRSASSVAPGYFLPLSEAA